MSTDRINKSLTQGQRKESLKAMINKVQLISFVLKKVETLNESDV